MHIFHTTKTLYFDIKLESAMSALSLSLCISQYICLCVCLSNGREKKCRHHRFLLIIKMMVIMWAWINRPLECQNNPFVIQNKYQAHIFHYYKNWLTDALWKGLGGGHNRKPPRLIPMINRGGHFLLIEAVIKNRLTKSVNRGSVRLDKLGPVK